jgi:hypothetical protein
LEFRDGGRRLPHFEQVMVVESKKRVADQQEAQAMPSARFSTGRLQM